MSDSTICAGLCAVLVAVTPTNVAICQAVEDDSEDLGCADFLLLGIKHLDQGDLSAAIDMLERGLSSCPDSQMIPEKLSEAHYRLGLESFNGARPDSAIGQFRRAVRFFSRCTDLQPDKLPCLYFLGTALLEVVTSGDHAEAERCRSSLLHFLELTEATADSASALYNLVALEHALGNEAEAEELKELYLGLVKR